MSCESRRETAEPAGERAPSAASGATRSERGRSGVTAGVKAGVSAGVMAGVMAGVTAGDAVPACVTTSNSGVATRGVLGADALFFDCTL